MKIRPKPKGKILASRHSATGAATLTLMLLVACAAELGQAAVVETHGNAITIKPFNWLHNSGTKKLPAQTNTADSVPGSLDHRETTSRSGAENEGPFNYAITPDGYLLAQFSVFHPTKESDLHIEKFWRGGKPGLEAPYNPVSSPDFGRYALLLFLESKQGDVRVACSGAAVELLHFVNESRITPDAMDYLMSRYDPGINAPSAVWENPATVTARRKARLASYQAAPARASNINKVRAYFVGPDNGAAQCDMQKGELYLSCKGPDGYGLSLKRGEDYLTQFSYADQHLSAIKMDVADLQNLVKSGDRYAFVYEVEGRLCKGEEKTLFCARKSLPQAGNFLMDVETTRLYLLRLPAQSGGLNSVHISLLNTNILPATIPAVRQEPVFVNYPVRSVSGRSPERQQQIDAAVEYSRRARMQQDADLGAAAGRGAESGASSIFNPY